jgi:eukaryotic-like serine/threonine-protein kinase
MMRTCPTCQTQYPESEQFCSRDGATLNSADGAAIDGVSGQTISGGYLLQERLGEGGMGIVYRAIQQQNQQQVAVKILRPEYTQNQDILTRFYQEARTVNQLQHPNITQLIEVSTLPDSRPCLVLEYLQGSDLAAILQDQGALSEARVIDIALQTTSALVSAHAAGVIHRDLKPDNIFLTQEEQVKILDFGLAKLINKKTTDEISREEARTRSGVIIGTPYYMSPEQACGKPVDAQTDIYALGIMIYEMLTGRVPFRSPDGPLHVLMQHLNEEPIPPSELQPSITKEIEQLVMHCLAKEKDHRYPSMTVLQQDLLLLQNGASTLFRPTTKKKRAAPTALFTSVAFTVALLTSLYTFTTLGTEEKIPATQPTTIISHTIPSKPSIITLTIETNPPGAQIYLDGQVQAQQTPAQLTLPAKNKVVLLLQKEGFEDNLQPISTHASLSLRLDLTALPTKGSKKTLKDTTAPDQLDPYRKQKP